MVNKSAKSVSKDSSKPHSLDLITSIAIIGGLVAAAAGCIYFIHGNKAAQKKIKQVKRFWALKKAKGEVPRANRKIKEVEMRICISRQ